MATVAAAGRIDVISDAICPWCYIGKRRLERALADRPDVEAQITWRAFQLNPWMPAAGIPREEYLKAKFGHSLLGTPASLWGGYTQSSRWQVYHGASSRPL